MCAEVSRGALQQRRKDALEVQVALVGINRRSASFGKALREFSNQPNARIIFNVTGFDDETARMKTAQEIGAIASYPKELAGAVSRADIVILDVALGEQVDYFERLGGHLKDGAVVIDLAPLKSPGVKLAKQYFPKNAEGRPTAYLVGATPLVRLADLYRDDHNLQQASAELFKGNDMLIAPAAAVSPEAVKLVSDIADFLEMKPRFLDPVEHDGLAGLMEVMPTVLGAMYFKTVQQSKGKTDLLRIANIRFANSTANLREEAVADLVTMWRWNKDNLLHHLEQTVQALETLREILMDDDPMALEVYIDQILDGFTEWEIRRRDNRWDEDIVDAPNIQPGFGGFGGVMNNFFNLRKRKDDE